LVLASTEPSAVHSGDTGYRGHGFEGESTVHVDERRRGRITRNTWRWMKRRSAIEPTIGHLKSIRRLDKNCLKGGLGDKMNVIFSAGSMNLPKIMKDRAGMASYFAYFLAWLLELLRIRPAAVSASSRLGRVNRMRGSGGFIGRGASRRTCDLGAWAGALPVIMRIGHVPR